MTQHRPGDPAAPSSTASAGSASEALLAAIVQSSEDAIIGKDLNGTIIAWNKGAERLFGYTAAEATGRPVKLIIPLDRLEEEERIMERMRRGEYGEPFETVRIRKDGTPVQISATISPIRDATGNIIGGSKIARDITKHKAVEDKIRQYNRQLRSLYAVTTVINESVDLKTVLSRALEEITLLVRVDGAEVHLCNVADELEPVAAYGLPPEFLAGSRHLRFPSGQGIPGQALATREPILVPDIEADPRYLRRDLAREAGLRSLICTPMLGRESMTGTLMLYSRRLREFTEAEQTLLLIIGRELAAAVDRARLFEQVQQLAITDPLTGLYNRRHFFELAELEFKTARRYRHSVSAMMIDVDLFKSLNDRYGHAIGDAALRSVAEHARQHVRSVDILGRYGGEEFTVLLPQTDSRTARGAAERLRRSVEQNPVATPDGPATVTISIGVATAPDHEADLATLLDRADKALYEAKEQGRNRVVSFIVR